jgi:hypothetical protein
MKKKTKNFQILLQRAFAHPFCSSHFGEFLPKKGKKKKTLPPNLYRQGLKICCFYVFTMVPV